MKKVILIILACLVVAAIGVASYGYSVLNTKFETDKTVYVYVDEEYNYDKLLQELVDSAKLESVNNFKLIASLKGYPEKLRTGRYAITPEDNVWSAINKLQRGLQTPTRVTFNNIRLKNDLIERISKQLMFSEEEFAAILNDSTRTSSYGFTPETVVAMFIPNTYEFYWDVSVDKFVDRMKKEFDTFWTSERLTKAVEINLTPLEISILASIVEEECMFSDEYPIVAGLYINRLQRGQLLQADPTVKYAVGDFSLQRILFKHLEVESPYNTYIHQGLPPSPIRIPSIKGLDAVLNYAKHDFIFMCAKEDFSGRHNFAKTSAEHGRNRAKYIEALNKRGIR